jgi:lipopolysaccharide exporter
LHPYRPRWCISKISEIWAISKWLMITGVGSFFLHRSDQLIAGRLSGTAQYGTYVVGMDIGQLAAGELGPSLTRPLYPILVALKNDWDRAKRATLKTLASVNSVTLPLGFGLAAVSNDATLVLLGNQWHAAIPFVAGFAIIGSIQYLTVPLAALLNVAGHVKVQSRIVWIEFLSFVLFAIVFVWKCDLIGLVFARIGSSLLQSILMLFAAQKYVQLSFFSSLRSLVRPLMSSILMYCFLIVAEFHFGGVLVNLIGNISIGALTYVFLLVGSWALARRPEGIESTVFDYLAKRF